MQRALFTFEIVVGAEDEYRLRHDPVWPDLVAEISNAGISNFTGFRRGSTVYVYGECDPDRDTAFASLEASDVNERWGIWFSDVIQASPEGREWINEVWHLE